MSFALAYVTFIRQIKCIDRQMAAAAGGAGSCYIM